MLETIENLQPKFKSNYIGNSPFKNNPVSCFELNLFVGIAFLPSLKILSCPNDVIVIKGSGSLVKSKW